MAGIYPVSVKWIRAEQRFAVSVQDSVSELTVYTEGDNSGQHNIEMSQAVEHYYGTNADFHYPRQSWKGCPLCRCSWDIQQRG